jgi:putative heme-binding domain-containing protein
LIADLPAGDAARGRTVFQSKKVACAACHKLKGEGGNVGPDLSQIGKIRARVDLLEAIVFPSTSFARGYEPHGIVTRDGQSFSGIVARRTSHAVYLKTAQREEIRIPLANIEEMAPSKVSIMPQGLDRVLSLQDLADLAALLEAMK